MTPAAQLADDLRALQAAGKIRSAWLPGMRVLGARLHGRVVLASGFGIQYIEWETHVDRHTYGSAEIPLSWVPDLSDPATRGCIAALAREASGDPNLCCRSWRDIDDPRDPAWGTLMASAWTEGEAWAAAIHAIRMEVCP